ncbi:hypothetical protein BCR33DRAFT_492525 [Rhizoclosmatium globosum]|uniref:Uncharacterized protein n=1 Tax=Rhizoclosmatium globosum TaxID=329046 RepID=A0A1Y2CUH5_9FUNG|nr:hypothetical protein BCR33DRAFT_492525 [Rhizoclosmatium globosum]|eukprot:ORY50708.1 hypothetical protein BCR33DRAFT_492525 [Rhizoclosmatium globosum]
MDVYAVLYVGMPVSLDVLDSWLYLFLDRGERSERTPSKFSLACGEMLLVLLWLEAKGEQIRHHRYSDPVILISILALFEFIMVTFFISIVLGVVAVVLLRFFLELSGLWRQPLELVFEMVRMDPVVLVQLNSMPPSAAVVYVQTGYKSIKTLLEQYSLTHPKFIKKQRPLPFNCKNPTCLLSSCRECGKEWTACHVCHEAEKDSLRLYVEQAMSEAFIRTVQYSFFSHHINLNIFETTVSKLQNKIHKAKRL